MTNSLKLLLPALLLPLLFAFKGSDNIQITGVYGGCNDTDPMVQLTLEIDHTFTYFDRSDPKNIIDVRGTWEKKGNAVRLITTNNDQVFHSKWHIHDNGGFATSRKGMAFYRLVKIQE